MPLLHLTGRGHTRIPTWILDHAGTVQSLAKLPSVAFLTLSISNDDGSPRKGLSASAFSLLLMATPEPVAKQDVVVALVREESLAGCYSLVVAPTGKATWPQGEFIVALQVKVAKKVGTRTITHQGRTVVRMKRD
jgi:hypothetical protein